MTAYFRINETSFSLVGHAEKSVRKRSCVRLAPEVMS